MSAYKEWSGKVDDLEQPSKKNVRHAALVTELETGALESMIQQWGQLGSLKSKPKEDKPIPKPKIKPKEEKSSPKLESKPKEEKSSPKLDLSVDTMIDCLDTVGALGKWRLATIVKVKADKVKVNYYGWQSKWDEWIEKGSKRLAPLGT